MNTKDREELRKILTEGVGAMEKEIEESGTCYLCEAWESFLVDSMVTFLAGMTAGYEANEPKRK